MGSWAEHLNVPPFRAVFDPQRIRHQTNRLITLRIRGARKMPSSDTQPSAGVFDGLAIRWDRTSVFLLGAVSLALAVVLGLLAPFTAVTWPWPVFLLLLGTGSIAALVYVADQERAAAPAASTSVRSARSALGAEAAVEGQPGWAEAQDRALFDNEQHVAREAERREQADRRDLDLPEDQEFLDDLRFEDEEQDAVRSVVRSSTAAPYVPPRADLQRSAARPAGVRTQAAGQLVPTHEELRAVARRVAQESSQDRGQTWEPVAVPKPTYARVAVAPRPAVEPMQAPAAPKSSGRPLREAAQAPQPQTERPGVSIDLDDVLSRRRA